MSVRKSSRKSTKRVEIPTIEHSSTKWSEKEIAKYLKCIQDHGHKNLKKLDECFPQKSPNVIKTFLRTAYDIAIRQQTGQNQNLDAWIEHCQTLCQTTPWKDSMSIARVIKYLSVPGLLENHPSPAQCEGINFPHAYRLIYQALMGYPIQPVNKETAKFVFDTLHEIMTEAQKEIKPTENVAEYVKGKSELSQASEKVEKTSKRKLPKGRKGSSAEGSSVTKPLRVYQRKRPKVEADNDEKAPSLQIVLEPNEQNPNLNGTKDYSMIINNKGNVHTVLNVPVPVGLDLFASEDKDEEELLQKSMMNPLKIPNNWLKEPFYGNLLMRNPSG